MKKRILPVFVCALMCVACTAEESQLNVIQCWSDGDFLGVLQIDRSIFEAKEDLTSQTHAEKYCVAPVESCVAVYDDSSKEGKVKGYACSPLPEGWLECDDERIDARKSTKHCGSCGNSCKQDENCKNGFCINKNVVDDPGDMHECTETVCSDDGSALLECNDGIINKVNCPNGCTNNACVTDSTGGDSGGSSDKSCTSDADCESGQFCNLEAGACETTSDSPTCEKGERKCADGKNTVLECNGSEWVEFVSCTSGRICQEGECKLTGLACDSDMKPVCATADSIQECISGNLKITNCDLGKKCVDGVCTNDYESCSAARDSSVCTANNTLETCKGGILTKKSCSVKYGTSIEAGKCQDDRCCYVGDLSDSGALYTSYKSVVTKLQDESFDRSTLKGSDCCSGHAYRYSGGDIYGDRYGCSDADYCKRLCGSDKCPTSNGYCSMLE